MRGVTSTSGVMRMTPVSGSSTKTVTNAPRPVAGLRSTVDTVTARVNASIHPAFWMRTWSSHDCLPAERLEVSTKPPKW